MLDTKNYRIYVVDKPDDVHIAAQSVHLTVQQMLP
jgi:hypothetical protein